MHEKTPSFEDQTCLEKSYCEEPPRSDDVELEKYGFQHDENDTLIPIEGIIQSEELMDIDQSNMETQVIDAQASQTESIIIIILLV